MPSDNTVYGFNEADADELIQLIDSVVGTFTDFSLPTAGSGESQVFVTPSGGIDKRSGATLGSATCTKATVTEGTREVGTDTDTVYNNFRDDIAGDVDIVAMLVDGIWLAIAEDCSSPSATTTTAAGGDFSVVGGGAALIAAADGVYSIMAEQYFISMDLNGSGGPLEPV